MKAEDHILAWIESSREHYDRLLDIEQYRKAPGFGIKSTVILEKIARLVADAYCEMIRCGDALRDDPYSAAELLEAAKLVATWEMVV